MHHVVELEKAKAKVGCSLMRKAFGSVGHHGDFQSLKKVRWAVPLRQQQLFRNRFREKSHIQGMAVGQKKSLGPTIEA